VYNFNSIKTVQLELSSRCNASCPQCARNYDGGITVSGLQLQSWNIEQIKKVFTNEFVKQLDLVYLCGSYGDPLICKDFIPIVKYFRTVNPDLRIGAHTNGSLRNKKFFTEIAGLIDFLGFGIDGLEDTNHLYRRNCIWNKVIENAQAYISAGGHAEWDFCVFKHNQHQVNDAKQLSQDLGFKKFNVKKTVRFFTYAHQLVDYIDVRDNNGNIEYKLEQPTNEAYVNRAYKDLVQTDLDDYIQNTCIKCNAERIQEVYIGADGYVFPCGWLHDRLYQTTIVGTNDNKKIKEKLKQLPSNCFKHPLSEIVDGAWFEYIKQSWHNQDRLDRCAMMCGTGINLIGEQNQEISYKE